jgi:hypothetical protein
MRLGTKILILTLTITSALAGIIVWVVTVDLTGHETDRARADIRRAVAAYFGRIDALHELVRKVVTPVIQDPANRSQLELLDGGDESAREHFQLFFRQFVQANLSDQEPAPTPPPPSPDGAPAATATRSTRPSRAARRCGWCAARAARTSSAGGWACRRYACASGSRRGSCWSG